MSGRRKGEEVVREPLETLPLDQHVEPPRRDGFDAVPSSGELARHRADRVAVVPEIDRRQDRLLERRHAVDRPQSRLEGRDDVAAGMDRRRVLLAVRAADYVGDRGMEIGDAGASTPSSRSNAPANHRQASTA